MRKIILIGRSECGKTTLRQALRGEKIHYHKTQYVNHFDVIIDTPGEYIETKNLGGAIALYSFEADVVGLLMNACEPFSLYPPCVTAVSTREVVGIVTQIDRPHANIRQAEEWLRLAGCEKIFFVNSKTGEGVGEILEYLREPGDVMPWDNDISDDNSSKKRNSSSKPAATSNRKSKPKSKVGSDSD